MKKREDFLEEKKYFSRRKEFLNMERVFFKKKVFEKKVILNIKCKIEGVFSVLNSGDKKTKDSNEQDDVKIRRFK